MIEAKNLTRKYGSLVAVDSITFQIPKGQIVGLLGHNGAGKTTTLKMLTGYLEPTDGSITIDNLNIETDREKVQNKIGYLSEQSPLYPDMPVWRYLEYVANLRGIPEEKQQQAVLDAIEATDLGSKSSEYINTLSKGYRQRVGVAQAIIHKPEILVLDEPTNGLDPTQILAMRKLITNLAKQATVIVSTHIMQEVEAICDRVVIVLQGKIALDSSLADLRKKNNIHLTVKEDLSQLKPILGGLTGIKELTPIATKEGYNQFKIEANVEEISAEALTPIIARTVCEKGLELYAINNEIRTLEAVFKEVNSGGVSHG